MTFTLISRRPSPFGRKILFALDHLGLSGSMIFEAADDQDRLQAINPLAKIPVLLLEDGQAIYDSRVILEYLDGIAGPGRIIPTDRVAKFEALRQGAVADGILEAALLIVYEGRYRPDQEPYEPWLSFQRGKIERALSALAAAPPTINPVTVGAIGLACALEYLDFRKPCEWRDRQPDLVTWLEDFNATWTDFAESRPAE